MSIKIDQEKCVQCGRCSEVCPGSLITVGKQGAEIACPADCWGCASCLKECAAGAISFFLGEDMGGGETTMQVRERGNKLHWDFYDNNGLLRTITVDRNSSNKY